MKDLVELSRYVMPVLAVVILALSSTALLRRRNQSLGAVFIRNPATNESFPLTSRETSLGLHKNCDIVLDYKDVLNEHAVIICGKDGWYLKKVTPDAPVFINGKPVRNITLLQNGDNIVIGTVGLIFQNNPGGQVNGK